MKSSEMMDKVAEVAPKIHGYILKTASEVRKSPFREEIVQELDGLMKQAISLETAKAPFQAIGSGIQKLPGSVKWTAGVAGTGVALALAGDMFDALKRGLTKGFNYRKMLADNPDLNGDDPDVIRNFNTLHRFNPEYSADPNVAGAYVRQAKQFSGDLGMVHGLAQSRQAIRGARKLPTVALPYQTMGPAAEKTDLEVQRLQQEMSPENLQAEEQMRNLQMEKLRQETGPEAQEMRDLQAQRFMKDLRGSSGGRPFKAPKHSGVSKRSQWAQQARQEGRVYGGMDDEDVEALRSRYK